jgi:hypothetical protein
MLNSWDTHEFEWHLRIEFYFCNHCLKIWMTFTHMILFWQFCVQNHKDIYTFIFFETHVLIIVAGVREWELNETCCTLYGLLTGWHKSYGHYPHMSNHVTSIVFPPRDSMDSRWELRYEWELNETCCTLYGLLTRRHKSCGHYPQVESRDIYIDPTLRLGGFKVGTTLLQGYEWKLKEACCILYRLLTGWYKSCGHYPHVESHDVYSVPASRLDGFKVGTTLLQGTSENWMKHVALFTYYLPDDIKNVATIHK